MMMLAPSSHHRHYPITATEESKLDVTTNQTMSIHALMHVDPELIMETKKSTTGLQNIEVCWHIMHQELEAATLELCENLW